MSITETWNRIEVLRRQSLPCDAKDGASEAELASLKNEVGASIPDSVVEVLSLNNGMDLKSGIWFYDRLLLLPMGTSDIVSSWQNYFSPKDELRDLIPVIVDLRGILMICIRSLDEHVVLLNKETLRISEFEFDSYQSFLEHLAELIEVRQPFVWPMEEL